MTAYCYFTKWTEDNPIKDKTTVTVAQVLCKGTEFVDEINCELCSLLNIEKRIATAYFSMTNGLGEPWNQTLQTALRKVINHEKQDDWDQHLDAILAAYKSTRHESTGMSPYFMVFHQHPRLPVDINNIDDMCSLPEESMPVIHETYAGYSTENKTSG